MTRRRLLWGGVAAGAGAAGAVLGRALPAGATTGNLVFGQSNDSDSDFTTLMGGGASAPTLILNNDNSVNGSPLKLTPSSLGNGPNFGTHALGELFVDLAGNLYVIELAGTPGTWRRVARAGAANADAANSPTGFLTSSDSVPALYGQNIDAQGAPLRLYPSSNLDSAPSSGTHGVGELFVDNNGVLHQCVGEGTPGTWVRQAPLVTLPSPVRVYDSRSGKPNQAPNAQGTLSFTAAPPSAANRVIRCSKDASSGTTVIPAGARTLLLNLTAVSVAGTGALSVYADGASQPATSNLNWTAGGQIVANAVTSACDGQQDIRVAVPASPGAVTNFIVDVFGYYL